MCNLYRMTKGMAKIEQGTCAAFALVRSNYLRLQLTAAFDGDGQNFGFTRQKRCHVRFQPVKKDCISHQAILDHLGQSGAQFPLGEGFQRRCIGKHAAWLMEGADHVLAPGMVDPGLAAHRGIHLREQRSRNLDEIHTTLITSGRKSGEVADHPAAQRRQHHFAIKTTVDQGIKNTA